MLAFNEFNPYALIGKQAIPDAKRAKGAKVDATSTVTLAGLAALAGQRPQFHHALAISTWQEYFDERMDVAERIGKMPRNRAKHMAYESCIVRWLDTHPADSKPDICAHCQQPSGAPGTSSVPVYSGQWLHHACLDPWRAGRRQEAVNALAGIIGKHGET